MTSQQSLANHSTEPTNSVSAKPGLAAYLQHSKVLVAIVAVLGVTVMALTAALVSKSLGCEITTILRLWGWS